MTASHPDVAPSGDPVPVESPPTDVGPVDAGPAVAGPVDAGPVDAGPVDAGRRPHPLSPLVHMWVGLLAFIFFVVRDLPEHRFDISQWSALRLSITLGMVGIFFIFGCVGGYLSWRHTRFVLDEQGLRIDRTLINHTSNRVLYTKVQAVDIVQPFAARLIGLAALKVDAGGEQQKIEFLKKSEAEQLRDELMRRAVAARTAPPEPEVVAEPSPVEPGLAESGTSDRTGAHLGHPPLEESSGFEAAVASADRAPQATPSSTPVDLESLREPSHLITSSSPKQLVLAAVLSAQFVSMLIGVIGLGVIPFSLTGELWGASAVIPAAFGLVGFITSRVINQWNYRLVETITGTLQISRGLTSTIHQSVPKQRIQGFAIRQSVLQRLAGLWEVQISVLGAKAGDGEEDTSTLLLPAGRWGQVLQAVNAVWPGFDPEALPTQGLDERGRWLRPLTFRSHRWASNDAVLLHRGGVIVHTIYAVHHARVQAVDLSQGPLQRRLGLASASASISSGPVHLNIPSLDAGIASQVVRGELALASRARAAEHAALARR